jgi:hypothetical protein
MLPVDKAKFIQEVVRRHKAITASTTALTKWKEAMVDASNCYTIDKVTHKPDHVWVKTWKRVTWLSHRCRTVVRGMARSTEGKQVKGIEDMTYKDLLKVAIIHCGEKSPEVYLEHVTTVMRLVVPEYPNKSPDKPASMNDGYAPRDKAADQQATSG